MSHGICPLGDAVVTYHVVAPVPHCLFEIVLAGGVVLVVLLELAVLEPSPPPRSRPRPLCARRVCSHNRAAHRLCYP
jgi:hypothetical protein